MKTLKVNAFIMVYVCKNHKGAIQDVKIDSRIFDLHSIFAIFCISNSINDAFFYPALGRFKSMESGRIRAPKGALSLHCCPPRELPLKSVWLLRNASMKA